MKSWKFQKNDIGVKWKFLDCYSSRKQILWGGMLGLGKISGNISVFLREWNATPLFIGLEGNLCQCPHWGYLLSRVTYCNGRTQGDEE
jgi:hypothetical protein